MYNNEEIKEKVDYCLNCKVKPCKKGCPLGNDIPGFISNIKQEKYEEAYKVLSKTTVMQSICGRICPHMSQCMGSCVRGIKSNPVSIGQLEYTLGDLAIEKDFPMEELEKDCMGKKVAVVGSGPVGLTCAAFLARKGANVTIYEKYSDLGGILRRGIPDFRLSKDILDNTIQKILDLGISVEYNKEIGNNIYLEDLTNKYDAVFIGIGANIPWKMGIEGENLQGVYGGNTLLEKQNHPDYTEKNVAIIGGGNVAMDCARTIKKMGAKNVSIIYRRSEKQMPAERKEIEDAKLEGVKFLFQNNVTKILGQDKVEKIECIKTELVEKEGETRKVPIDIEGSNYIISMDYVVMAIGSAPEEKILNKLNLERTKKGYIKVDEAYRTSIKKVFAGGDIIGQKATVAWAARTGRDAAYEIAKYLNN